MVDSPRLIVNADDFGLDPAVNAAVLSAHQGGILRSASLMVSAPAAAEAVAMAKAHPSLAVGLHLTLVDGEPVLPQEQVSALVDASGRFAADLWQRGFHYFFSPRAHRQLRAEIEAQFALFADSGLCLDHANAHKHLHAHPTVLRLMLAVGRRFGLRAVRVPREPLTMARQLAPVGARAALGARLLFPWVNRMQRFIRAQGFGCNDFLLGLLSTGQMDGERLHRALQILPAGSLTELYFHPAQEHSPRLRALMPDYRPVAEWQGLLTLAPDALGRHGIRWGSYGDFFPG